MRLPQGEYLDKNEFIFNQNVRKFSQHYVESIYSEELGIPVRDGSSLPEMRNSLKPFARHVFPDYMQIFANNGDSELAEPICRNYDEHMQQVADVSFRA